MEVDNILCSWGLAAGLSIQMGLSKAASAEQAWPSIYVQPATFCQRWFDLHALTMSGIEIAGLAFGILPLLVEIVKSYSTIMRKARTFRHYGKAVKSLSAQLETQNGIFLNEVRLLLLSVEEEKAIESMLGNENDRRWSSKELGDRLNLVLRENFDVCRGTIEMIKDLIDELGEDLKRFDVFLERKPKVSVQSVRDARQTAAACQCEGSRHAAS